MAGMVENEKVEYGEGWKGFDVYSGCLEVLKIAFISCLLAAKLKWNKIIVFSFL